MIKYILFMLLGLLVVGCGPYVKVSHEGEKVRLLNKHQVGSCERLGGTTVSVLDKVAFIKREKASVEDNLQALARNSATEMSGDTIVAVSGIVDGGQKYDVYRCVKP
jgi:starvation-inducible outer membrane lipoprotein